MVSVRRVRVAHSPRSARRRIVCPTATILHIPFAVLAPSAHRSRRTHTIRF